MNTDTNKADTEYTEGGLLPLRHDMTTSERINVLQSNALTLHQNSVGRGDVLVRLLEHTVRQMEFTQKRLQVLNTVFFYFGLAVLGIGILVALFSDAKGAVWGSILGAGGLTSAVSLFITAPMNKIAESVRDLVQLETAFLGYIRVLGEIDSAFQWQYIEKMRKTGGPSINAITQDTCESMQSIMDKTMALIDQYISKRARSGVKDIHKKLEEMEKNINDLVRQAGQTE